MASGPRLPPPPSDDGELMGSGVGTSTSPVAVVWCRQVDNEAESPGYTTVPEEFPGHHETLEAIRIVGNLTINVADTHDYWDPDPSQPLSYYPNLFLYPACGGRYTCVGRMFLSTEDRPRLGMKTLVLDTGQLLASGDFGAAVLRWHASMGGPRRDGTRPPPPPDPGLYALLGEGLLFHRGSTDPVLIVASDAWESAVQATLALVRTMPASLVALGAILAFPYFLPQPKTNLHELTEQIPLALALMRVPPSEAAGDRHAKRMASWESAPLTIRDLTDGRATAGRAKENVPLVLQFVRDRAEAKLRPIAQRVDLVEIPRLRGHLGDPERQGGRDRRKEMWRIGTAMESAALLLQRARGRHVPVSVETAKRAQEYLQARVPTSAPTVAPEPAVVAPEPAAGVAAQLPPWLQRAPDSAPPPPSVSEVVPVSVSDDPSLLKGPAPPPLATPAARTAAPAVAPAAPAPPPPRAAPLPPAAPPPAAAPPPLTPSPIVRPSAVAAPPPAPPAPTSADAGPLRAQVQAELVRYLDDRLTQMKAPVPPPGPATALDAGLRAELETQWEARITALREAQARDIDRLLTTFAENLRTERAGEIEAAETRVRGSLTAHVDSEIGRRSDATQQAVAVQIAKLLQQAEERQRAALADQARAAEARVREGVLAALPAEVDRRVATSLEPRVSELGQRFEASARAQAEASRGEAKAELARAVEGLRARSLQAETELKAAVAAQVDAAAGAMTKRLAELQTAVDRRLTEALDQAAAAAEARAAAQGREVTAQMTALVEGRARATHATFAGASEEQERRFAELVDGRVAAAEERVREKVDGLLNESNESRLHAIADLQVRMQAYFEQKIREDQDRERQKYLELLARLKGEVDASLGRMVDSARFDTALREKIGRTTEAFRTETQRLLDARVANAEQQFRLELADAGERLQRIEQAIEERRTELQQLDEAFRAEVDDLDRRTQILADRLVPVVRKTWLKINEVQKGGAPADVEAQVNQLRREFNRDVRRLESELAERTTEIRERMETTITNQGRVWLTLVRQLSQLTEDRRAVESARAGLAAVPVTSAREGGVPEALDEIPELLPPRRGSRRTDDEPVNPLDPEPDADDAPRADGGDRGLRRRLRRPSR